LHDALPISGGETGRHRRLKIFRPQGLAGSIPAPGTIQRRWSHMQATDIEVPLPADDARVAVIGLGYVGLPLAVAFGARRRVLGLDRKSTRLAELRAGHDRT